MTEYKEIVSWTGRRDPISGKRDKTFTIDQNKFANIEDARKAKRQANLDPFKDTPLPNIYKGPVPIMETIIQDLQKKNEGWGEQKKKTSKKRKPTNQMPITMEGIVPTLDEIIPKLKKKSEGWGGKSHRKKPRTSKAKTRKQRVSRKRVNK